VKGGLLLDIVITVRMCRVSIRLDEHIQYRINRDEVTSMCGHPRAACQRR
jgi:hypothetical protein